MKYLFIFLFIASLTANAQQSDKEIILKILDDQTKAWNAGNIDQFMIGYWENDSLMYIGKSGITYGYRAALETYKTRYDSREKMGQLNFNIIHVKKLSPEYYQVVGKWHLKRTIGDASGFYTLLFRKIQNKWVIVSDHSS